MVSLLYLRGMCRDFMCARVVEEPAAGKALRPEVALPEFLAGGRAEAVDIALQAIGVQHGRPYRVAGAHVIAAVAGRGHPVHRAVPAEILRREDLGDQRWAVPVAEGGEA